MNSNGSDSTKQGDWQKETGSMEKAKEKEEVGVMSAPTTMRKWGNSLGVIISKDIASSVGADVGSEFELKVIKGDEGKEIRLVPKKQQKEYSLQDLLSKCKPENRHNEIDWGIEGNELI